MRLFQSHFTRTHFFIALGFTVAFMVLTWIGCQEGTPDDLRQRHSLAATLGTASGPFTGALARPGQGDCWRCGWILLPYCGGILLAAALFQMFKLPFRRGATALRIGIWILGLLGWFAGGFFSMVYAFD